jgi:peptidoglycan/xylan/chitin deacetylase (PgdA/CDA1 family)
MPAERLLASSMVRALMTHRMRGRRIILAYHGIVPDGEPEGGERSLHVRQADFGRQLDRVQDLADVVPLNQIDFPSTGRPRVAITFDDAYRGAVVEGVQEVSGRGLPATIFVAPRHLGRHVFWWDALAGESGMLGSDVRRHALGALAGVDARVRDWAERAGVPSTDDVPMHARTATLDELRHASRIGGISIGSHTWSHANLARLGRTEIVGELRQAHEFLRREFGATYIAWLAYPYGLDSPDARAVAAEMRYDGALRVSGGWHRTSDVPRYGRPRLNVSSGITLSGLGARMNGVVRS